jgi:TonB family protein
MNMSCTDVASVLDSHRIARLAPAERAQIDAHLTTCADCTAAWHAQAELAALRVPSVPATLLERALLASRLPQSAPARRARMSIIVASVLLAGAAAAAVTIVSLTRAPSAGAPVTATGETSATPSETLEVGIAPSAASSAPAAADDRPTAVDLVETGRLDVIPLVRENPQYPPRALAEGLSGHVQLKFDVTAAGTVENVSVVESSDAVFEESAAAALAQWRYLPRILAGRRVRHEGVHTILRFQLVGSDKDAKPDPTQEAVQEKAMRESREYGSGLVVALDRLALDDFRGVELQLDEMQALYGTERPDLWNFYGYLYTLQGNYGRAIDAYEQAVAVSLRAAFPTSGPIVPLAKLYFARHQYDMALKTLLRPGLPTDGAVAPGGNRRLGDEATALIQQLRALGVTEQTL